MLVATNCYRPDPEEVLDCMRMSVAKRNGKETQTIPEKYDHMLRMEKEVED